MRGKRMAQGVGTDGLDNTSLTRDGADCALQHDFVQMMTPAYARTRVNAELPGGKRPLPSPFLGRIGIFPVQGMWQIDAAAPADKVPLMQFSYADKMSGQRCFHDTG